MTQVQIQVTDSTTGKPVSGAAVSVAGKNARTGGSGAATVNVPNNIASGQLTVSANGFSPERREWYGETYVAVMLVRRYRIL